MFDASKFEEPSTAQAAELIEEWGATLPALVLLSDDEAPAGKSFRNLARVDVMPVSEAGVADVVGAASLLVSQTALPELVARASGRTRDGGEEDESPAPRRRTRPAAEAESPAPRRRTRATPPSDAPDSGAAEDA